MLRSQHTGIESGSDYVDSCLGTGFHAGNNTGCEETRAAMLMFHGD